MAEDDKKAAKDDKWLATFVFIRLPILSEKNTFLKDYRLGLFLKREAYIIFIRKSFISMRIITLSVFSNQNILTLRPFLEL